MGTGFTGTFVISWTQTELDGLASAPLSDLRVGTAWSWTGDAVRVDGPTQVLRLGAAVGEAEFRQRVGRGARRIVGPDFGAAEPDADFDESLFQTGFTITDGRRTWAMAFIQSSSNRTPLLMVKDDLPPKETDLWVVGHNVTKKAVPKSAQIEDAVVCFTPGTLIETETGPKAVELLLPGDRIQTRDDGLQPLVWLGRRHISGARLRAHPGLSPVRFAPGALGDGRPPASLIVSPAHRVLVKGSRAQALWGTDEVLVCASDLVDHDRVSRVYDLKSVTYYHLYLPSHQIVFAGGVEAESFHPAFADLDLLTSHARSELQAVDPDVAAQPGLYGAPVRRMLSGAEASLLTAQF